MGVEWDVIVGATIGFAGCASKGMALLITGSSADPVKKSIS